MAAGTIATFKADGSVGVRTEDANGVVSRHVVVPGAFTDASTFVATDLTAEVQEVKDAAAAGWVPQVIAAWKAAHPFVPAPALTPDQQRVLAILANPRRQALLTAALQTDDAGIVAYINNNVTDLASARVMLANLALLVLAVIRS